jgi:regulator of nonsense transcripts 3
MTQETFTDQVSPLPDHDYLYFVKGDLSLGQFAFSRAYIDFINQEDIFIFTEKFDGYVFVDQKGE